MEAAAIVESQYIPSRLHAVTSKVAIQAGLILCQGYFPDKCSTNKTQNPHLKQCISWGLVDWQPRPIQRMTIPQVDIWTCRAYIYCI